MAALIHELEYPSPSHIILHKMASLEEKRTGAQAFMDERRR